MRCLHLYLYSDTLCPSLNSISFGWHFCFLKKQTLPTVSTSSKLAVLYYFSLKTNEAASENPKFEIIRNKQTKNRFCWCQTRNVMFCDLSYSHIMQSDPISVYGRLQINRAKIFCRVPLGDIKVC